MLILLGTPDSIAFNYQVVEALSEGVTFAEVAFYAVYSSARS
jgi:hypothetical protein